MRAMAFVITPIAIVLILAVEPILETWLSKEFASNSSIIAMVLMASLLPSSMARIVSSRLNGLNRPDLVVKILFAECLPYGLALYFFAIEYGLLGVSLVWALRSAVDALLLAATARIALPMVRMMFFPTMFVLLSLGVSIGFGMQDPRRWLASALITLMVATWVCFFMPPDLAKIVRHFRLLRRLPVGRYGHVGLP
jgi:O-antigen/teichoic acid export membrane protein